ncbi:hypothetical protein H6P81_009200 [Aristolochia fimbriata]|uniref:Uncharacterized protein n=1 Tax=Aristolochia fimbriata TaxID=158543 RepID=A0AAV7EK69_ARIFI|nr:hypothetical protein H6P81_009200 [Aristolochia fimbriata]
MAEGAEASSSDTQSTIPSSSDDALKQPRVPAYPGGPAFPNYGFQMQFMYPALAGLAPTQTREQANLGAGIYAVPVHPFMGSVAGLPSDTLIPLNYTVPTRSSPAEGAVTGEQGQEGRQQPQAQQRQVVLRRFQFAFQLDLFLILKLAAVVFVFNQDGSRQKLILLLFIASLVYLYQTGVLTPLIRWLSQGMHRAAAPPQPRPPVRAMNEGVPANAGAHALPVQGEQGNEDENRPAANDADPQAIQNENPVEPARREGWLGIAREIQMIVIGFITSLLPGYHNID